MARKQHQDALGVSGAETIIGTAVVVHGNLESEADITIDGELDGKITTSGDVTIGVNARISAPIRGGNVTVSGHLTGDIHATGVATIRETGQVEGNITAGGLAILPGGIFVGQSRMKVPTPETQNRTLPGPDTKETDAPSTNS